MSEIGRAVPAIGTGAPALPPEAAPPRRAAPLERPCPRHEAALGPAAAPQERPGLRHEAALGPAAAPLQRPGPTHAAALGPLERPSSAGRLRIGLFGGTFDPPHLGHLIVAGEAYEALRLDRLFFIPAADPPHKLGGVGASSALRARMLRAAIGVDPRFAIDELELRRGGTSYTIDTVRELHARWPDAELHFLLGADQYRAFASWRAPEEIVRFARLAVLSRDGEHPEPLDAFPARVVAVSRIDISSTRIRERAAAGRSLRYYVPDGVRMVIEREALYRIGNRE